MWTHDSRLAFNAAMEIRMGCDKSAQKEEKIYSYEVVSEDPLTIITNKKRNLWESWGKFLGTGNIKGTNQHK
jgi:hypothetical protein